MTKLMFTGIATGVALSCAFVLATSLTSAPEPGADISTHISTGKADRLTQYRSPQRVVRSRKSDPLTITMAILAGKNFIDDDQVPFSTDTVSALDSELADAVVPEAPVAFATPVVTLTPPAETKPVTQPQRFNVVTTIGEPINIIPVPQTVQSEPASVSTDTNFSVEQRTAPRTGLSPELIR